MLDRLLVGYVRNCHRFDSIYRKEGIRSVTQWCMICSDLKQCLQYPVISICSFLSVSPRLKSVGLQWWSGTLSQSWREVFIITDPCAKLPLVIGQLLATINTNIVGHLRNLWTRLWLKIKAKYLEHPSRLSLVRDLYSQIGMQVTQCRFIISVVAFGADGVNGSESETEVSQGGHCDAHK